MATKCLAIASVTTGCLICAAMAGCGSESSETEPPQSVSRLKPTVDGRHERGVTAGDIVRLADLVEFPVEGADELSRDGTEQYLRSQIQTARRRAAYEQKQHKELFDAVNGRRSYENPDLHQRIIEIGQEPPPEPDPRVFETLRSRYVRQTGDVYVGRSVIRSN